ncbi:hypothetical protein Hanom_Chr17g01561471 [Helianthus anomalus]
MFRLLQSIILDVLVRFFVSNFPVFKGSTHKRPIGAPAPTDISVSCVNFLIFVQNFINIEVGPYQLFWLKISGSYQFLSELQAFSFIFISNFNWSPLSLKLMRFVLYVYKSCTLRPLTLSQLKFSFKSNHIRVV